MRPNTWTLFLMGGLVALAVATALTLMIPRMYPVAAVPSRASS